MKNFPVSLYNRVKADKIMSFSTKTSAFDVYRPFFTFSKLYGLGTFKFRNGKFENCRLGFLAFFVNLLIIVWLLIEQKESELSFSKILSIGMVFLAYLPYVAAFLFVVLNFHHRKKFHEIYMKLDDFDDKVK